MTNYEKFKQEIKNNILEREDFENWCNLMDWLDGTDFKTAPASTKYHLCIEGGLCLHSLNVAKAIKVFDKSAEAQLVALVHDLCKVNFYKRGFRNVKDYDGDPDMIIEQSTNGWSKVLSWDIDEKLIMGHGEKSVYLLQKYGIKFTDEEYQAIRYHMGDFTDQNVSKVYSENPLAIKLHMADLAATYLMEADNGKTS